MKLIRSLLGRRQFLIAAGAASASAQAFRKIAGFIAKGFQANSANVSDSFTRIAMAGENPRTANVKGTINRYSHLLSPLKIGNVVLKNRMSSNNATPHFLQGPENFASDAMRSYYENIAKNGAAVVTCRIVDERLTPRSERREGSDNSHMAIYDNNDYGVQNYLQQMAEGIKCYGAKASFAIKVSEPPGYQISKIQPGAEMSVDMLQKRIEDTVRKAKFFQSHGFEMVCLANTLSPYMKDRTDQYGGTSIENQGRFAKEVYQAVKSACRIFL